MNQKLIPRRSVLAAGAALAGLCTGCAVLPQGGDAASSEAASESAAAQTVEKADTSSIHLRDNNELYTVYDDSGVVTMYLTVSRGNSSENTDHSWSSINHYSVYDYEAMGVPRYQVNGLLQVGDENGPAVGELGFGETVPNATVQIRGQTSSQYDQKNYKIKLKKNKGSWRGQRTIALNKHQMDGLRFRNKMAFDLIRGIDEMMGLRTQFVHLYVKDLTDSAAGAFVDYGLYTQVEQLNKTALRAHGLNPESQLYKVEYFEFLRHEDVIRLETDPAYDKGAFEKLLEIKGSSDHAKLIKMLDALNDVSQDIDVLLDKYFDVENLTYWLAFQLLTGNVDTQNRNTYLYSPLNLDRWYLLNWDSDAMLMREENRLRRHQDAESWESGVSNYWGNMLFRRCLQSRDFRAALDSAVDDLLSYLSEERITEMTAHYRSVVEQYIWKQPDVTFLPVTKENYEHIASNLPAQIEDNYRRYQESYDYPMPFYISPPEVSDGQLRFTWDASYDFDAEDIYYSVEVARDYLFRDTIYQQTDLVMPELLMYQLPAGQYFVRVRATNASGYTQDAFDYYVTDTGSDDGKHYGMICFYVLADGTIAEDTYE